MLKLTKKTTVIKPPEIVEITKHNTYAKTGEAIQGQLQGAPLAKYEHQKFEYAQFAEYMQKNTKDKSTRIARYYSTEEREKTKVKVVNNLLCDSHSKRLDSLFLFVIGPDLELYVDKKEAHFSYNPMLLKEKPELAQKIQLSKDTDIKHSSFFSGGPVLSGGHLKISNGKPVYIINDSGHYKPQAETLLFFALWMTMNNIDPYQVDFQPFGASKKIRLIELTDKYLEVLIADSHYGMKDLLKEFKTLLFGKKRDGKWGEYFDSKRESLIKEDKIKIDAARKIQAVWRRYKILQKSEK